MVNKKILIQRSSKEDNTFLNERIMKIVVGRGVDKALEVMNI